MDPQCDFEELVLDEVNSLSNCLILLIQNYERNCFLNLKSKDVTKCVLSWLCRSQEEFTSGEVKADFQGNCNIKASTPCGCAVRCHVVSEAAIQKCSRTFPSSRKKPRRNC